MQRSYEGQDVSGLVRSTILGMRLMQISRNNKTGQIDENFINDTLEDFKHFCEITTIKDFDMTIQDLIDLSGGNINKIIPALKKLIKLLPITPIDLNNQTEIYAQAREFLLAA